MRIKVKFVKIVVRSGLDNTPISRNLCAIAENCRATSFEKLPASMLPPSSSKRSKSPSGLFRALSQALHVHFQLILNGLGIS